MADEPKPEKPLVRRDHFVASGVGALALVMGGGGVGVSQITTKLDAQTKEIVELRLSIVELKAARDNADKAGAKTDDALARALAQIAEARQEVATQRIQLVEHERRIASLEREKNR